MISIDHQLLDRVSALARSSPRRRMNYNFHSGPADPVQRMLNAIEPFSYIRPHKHEQPDKREAFFILRGSLLVIEFNDDGSIDRSIILDHTNGNYGAEISERRYHSLLALQPGTVIYELKDGPYNPIDDKNFAPWAPAEEDPSVNEYILHLFHQTSTPPPNRQ